MWILNRQICLHQKCKFLKWHKKYNHFAIIHQAYLMTAFRITYFNPWEVDYGPLTASTYKKVKAHNSFAGSTPPHQVDQISSFMKTPTINNFQKRILDKASRQTTILYHPNNMQVCVYIQKDMSFGGLNTQASFKFLQPKNVPPFYKPMEPLWHHRNKPWRMKIRVHRSKWLFIQNLFHKSLR